MESCPIPPSRSSAADDGGGGGGEGGGGGGDGGRKRPWMCTADSVPEACQNCGIPALKVR